MYALDLTGRNRPTQSKTFQYAKAHQAEQKGISIGKGLLDRAPCGLRVVGLLDLLVCCFISEWIAAGVMSEAALQVAGFQ